VCSPIFYDLFKLPLEVFLVPSFSSLPLLSLFFSLFSPLAGFDLGSGSYTVAGAQKQCSTMPDCIAFSFDQGSSSSNHTYSASILPASSDSGDPTFQVSFKSASYWLPKANASAYLRYPGKPFFLSKSFF